MAIENEELLVVLAEQSRSLGRIEGKLSELMGNGQPGLVKEMRDDIDALKQTRNYALGFAGALTFLEVGTHYLLNKLGLK